MLVSLAYLSPARRIVSASVASARGFNLRCPDDLIPSPTADSHRHASNRATEMNRLPDGCAISAASSYPVPSGSFSDAKVTRRIARNRPAAGHRKDQQRSRGHGWHLHRSVESHRNHIMKKLNFSSFSELMRFAIRNHLIEPSPSTLALRLTLRLTLAVTLILEQPVQVHRTGQPLMLVLCRLHCRRSGALKCASVVATTFDGALDLAICASATVNSLHSALALSPPPHRP
jgi:hypothetical protein